MTALIQKQNGKKAGQSIISSPGEGDRYSHILLVGAEIVATFLECNLTVPIIILSAYYIPGYSEFHL